MTDRTGNIVGAPSDTPPLFPYIDCVRGYAVMLVISSHLSYAYPQLPYHAARFIVIGWHGVQLFFLASAMTLLMSWHFRAGREQQPVASFFVRRFFRIAPAYYAAALLYWFVRPPQGGFDPVELLTALSFTNGWTPGLLPTVTSAWHVVPGGWSITVEFTFYLLFPLFAAMATSLRRAWVIFGLCLLAGAAANGIAYAIFAGHYAALPLDEFLYMWFPDQMAVFALGAVVHFAAQRMRKTSVVTKSGGMAGFIARHGNLCPAAALIAFVAVSQLPLPGWTGQTFPYVPLVIAVSLCLAAFILALALARRSWFLNPIAAAVGRVSFSAYLLHFAVIHFTVDQFPALFHAEATRMAAVAAYVAGWPVVVAITFGLSFLSYKTIELPMMEIGKRLARRTERHRWLGRA